jgi:hypothetical protein
VLAWGRQTLRRGFRARDFSDKGLDGQQAVLKCFRRSGIVPTPTALCDAPTNKLLIPFEESSQEPIKLFSAMQDQDQASSRGMLRVSPIVTLREGFEKIAFRAAVVVFGHLPGSA